MPPIWPFGKKKEPDQLEEAPPTPIMYKMGESASQQTLADETHKNSNDYKSALALFGGGETDVKKAEDQSTQYDGVVSGDGQLSSAPSQTTQNLPEITKRTEAPKQVQTKPPAVPSKPAPPAVPKTPAFTWVHHSDGYHYKKKSDGSFDATPHVKNNSGSYIPYS